MGRERCLYVTDCQRSIGNRYIEQDQVAGRRGFVGDVMYSIGEATSWHVVR